MKPNFVSRPGLEQKLDVSLKITGAAATGINQTLYHQCCRAVHETDLPRLASRWAPPRREPGRQANEVLRNVSLTRPFYLSLMEVTNSPVCPIRLRSILPAWWKAGP